MACFKADIMGYQRKVEFFNFILTRGYNARLFAFRVPGKLIFKEIKMGSKVIDRDRMTHSYAK